LPNTFSNTLLSTGKQQTNPKHQKPTSTMADAVASSPDVVAAPNADVAAEHKYQFNVSMSCGGCSGAIDRVLKRMEGAFLLSPYSPGSLTYLLHPQTLPRPCLSRRTKKERKEEKS
jgi:copper chaperone